MRIALTRQQPALDEMKVSAKAEYACLAVLALAQQGGGAQLLRIREISEANGIPGRYLVQILLRLKGAGIVESARGSAGGYRLARPAARISLDEVLTAIDGPEAPQRSAAFRRGPAASALASVWESVRAAERAVLERTTIAQLVEQSSAEEWII
jgi:Rrf2 family transcriptional regulator, cysteine metabolism repressor